MATYPLEDINNRILEIEDEFNIYDQTFQSIYAYERIRYSIFKLVQAKTDTTLKGKNTNEIGKKTSSENLSTKASEYVTALTRTAKGSLFNNPYFRTDNEYLLFGTSKKFKNQNGEWADKILDPVMDELPGRHLLLERSDHSQPLQADNVAYIDFPWYVGHIPAELGAPNISLNRDETRILLNFEHALEQEFDIDIEVRDRVKHHLARRQVRLPLFRALIRRTDPEFVIMRGAFGEMKSTFIEACHSNDVEVVDCQFRALNKNEGHYHYPGERTKRVKADYFLTWGDYWTESIELPFDEENVFSVGYPYIEDQYEHYRDTPTDIDVLFVSSLAPGYDLSKFAAKFAKECDQDLRIAYKLHPGEYDDWQSTYPWLVDSGLEVIDDSSVSLYELFSRARCQVGVTSTALYEGYRFGLKTYLVDGLPGLFEMAGLIEDEYATLIKSPSELHSHLESENAFEQPEGLDTTGLFESEPRKNIRSVFKNKI